MKLTDSLPTTENCRLFYVKGGVNYSTVLTTPPTVSELQRVMLFERKTFIHPDAILRVEPVHPVDPLQRNHPAQHRMVQYMHVRD